VLDTHVGPVLFCDFLKNIGFPEFVKVDYHFQKEFPNLTDEKLSIKKQFIRSLELCKILGVTPFYFDHLMYQWGRYKSLHKEEFQSMNSKPSIKNEINDANADGKKRFEKLIQQNKKWRDECTKLTVHRQIQLASIFDKYGGKKIPFSHFTHEICRNPSLRNSEAYPAVCAYLSGILRKENDGLVKPDGIQWGKRKLPNIETYWL
jgi:hypothetical protein